MAATDEERETMGPTTQAPPHVTTAGHERRSGIRLGLIAGTLGISCCIVPTALALVGLSSASAAIAMGNNLYYRWGWAFKGAAVAFAAGAIYVQRQRAKACAVDARPDVRKTLMWIVAVGVATYAFFYVATKALAELA